MEWWPLRLIAPFYWTPMVGNDWWWMAALCITGVLGHFLLIKALELANAATTQPLAYFHLVFVSLIGLFVFNESMDSMMFAGVTIIMSPQVYLLFGVVTLNKCLSRLPRSQRGSRSISVGNIGEGRINVLNFIKYG